MRPSAFFVGFPETGEQRLANLFEENGLATCYENSHRINDELAYRRLAGESAPPLIKNFDLVIGLESKIRFGRPFISEYLEINYITSLFPNSALIFSEIQNDKWIEKMKLRNSGLTAAFQAWWLGVSERDLPEIWASQFERQKHKVEVLKKNGKSVIFLDSEAPIKDWCDNLSPFFKFKNKNISAEDKYSKVKKTFQPLSESRVPAVDLLEITAKLARHCVGQQYPKSTGGAVMSSIYAEWDGEQSVNYANGEQLPIRFGELGGRFRCISKGGIKKINRVEGVINEALSFDISRPLNIDMQDCRTYGVKENDVPERPVLAYCRRGGAKNVVLWPLPEYHSIGSENFVGVSSHHDIEFQSKEDTLFWRGAISGHCSDVYQDIFSNEVWRVANSLVAQPDREDLWRLLYSCTRISVLERYKSEPGIDLGFVSGPGFDMFKNHSRTKQICRNPSNRFGILRHRYLLSMRGYDTGSNFISAANSNSVVFKEEDGWELFYTPLFRPWESYIPLSPGLTDLQDKLDWARSNLTRCMEISAAARKACNYLTSTKNRKLLLRTIAESF